MHSYPRQWVEVCDQPHAPAALPVEKEPAVFTFTGYGTGWASELVWTRWRTEKVASHAGCQTR
jgi:hypothetical protein